MKGIWTFIGITILHVPEPKLVDQEIFRRKQGPLKRATATAAPYKAQDKRLKNLFHIL